MNARHRKFASEYLKNGGNGVQAIFAAGYKIAYNSACVRASQLLRNSKVRSMIDKPLDEAYYKAAEAAELTAERVTKEIARVAFTEAPIDTAAKMKGLEMATRVLGMVTQKVETIDLTERDATATALTTHIAAVAASEGCDDDTAAIGLFTRLSATHHPTLSDPRNWGKWQGVIEKSIADKAAQRVEPSEVSGNM